jgi:hypothetical protein
MRGKQNTMDRSREGGVAWRGFLRDYRPPSMQSQEECPHQEELATGTILIVYSINQIKSISNTGSLCLTIISIWHSLVPLNYNDSHPA